MKQTISSALIGLILLTGATSANAQAFDVGTKHLNIGLGFGGYYNYGYFSGSDHSQIPTIFLSYDQGIIADVGPGIVGIGGFLGYSSSTASYDYVGYSWKWSWTNFVIGARGTYHWPVENEKVDLYGALGLGLWMQKYSYTDTDPFWDGSLDVDETYMDLYYAFSVGGKYMFSPNFGVFGELGWDIAYLKVGVTLGLGGASAE